AQDYRLQPPRVLPQTQQPTVKIAIIRQVDIGQEGSAKYGRGAAQLTGREARSIGAALNEGKIDVELPGTQFDILPIGHQSRKRRLVDQRADLAEAPAQRTAWIIRDIPKHLAELLAPVRAPGQNEIGQERARLARRR